MYAVVDIKGFQYKLEKGDTLRVPKFDIEVGKKVKLSNVLFIADGEKYSIGRPAIEGAVVEATVTDQGKYEKIIVFKKKKRKDYSVKRGHRQDFTEISIDSIKISGAKKAAKTVAEKPEEIKDTETTATTATAATATIKEKAPESPVKKTKAKAPEKTAPDTQAVPKKADSALPSEKADKASRSAKKETKAKKTVTKKPDTIETAQAKPESADTSE